MPPFSPVTHLIAFGILAWLYMMLARVSVENVERRTRISVVGVLFGWVVVSSAIAYRGLYLSLNEEYQLVMIGIAAPVILLGALAAISGNIRRLFGLFVERTSLESLTFVHVLRILAIGTIYKWYIGALPGHFIIPVAIPDFLIGLTAVYMSRRVAANPASSRTTFVAWNLIGAGALLLAAPLIQLSQPGPLHVFSGGIRTDEVLSFPMVLVPTFIAPVLLTLHVVALVKVARAGRI